jgi:hypothetical protein
MDLARRAGSSDLAVFSRFSPEERIILDRPGESIP